MVDIKLEGSVNGETLFVARGGTSRNGYDNMYSWESSEPSLCANDRRIGEQVGALASLMLKTGSYKINLSVRSTE